MELKRGIVWGLSVWVSFLVHAATWTGADGVRLEYEVSGNSATITRWNTLPYNFRGGLEIPAELGSCPVRSIGSSAFSYCSGLTSVAIPDSVTNIGAHAFYTGPRRGGIVSIVIPAGLTSIGSDAFASWSLQNIEVQTDEMAETVDVRILSGLVGSSKVTVAVAPTVKTVKAPTGVKVKVMRDGHDITAFLDIPKADASGAVDLASATVKDEIVQETFDTEKGAEIRLDDPSEPTLKTALTKPGLVYVSK